MTSSWICLKALAIEGCDIAFRKALAVDHAEVGIFTTELYT